MRALAAGLALAVAGAAGPAYAQQVRGTVRDSDTTVPVPGAVVSVVDSAGHIIARAIADAQGRFLFAAAPGAARLQVVRIGFRPRDLRLPPPAPGGDITANVAMLRLAALLESVRVSDNALCPGSTDRGDAFTLWEQARAALLATIVARDTKPATVRMLTYQRTLYPGSDDIAQQTVHEKTSVSSRPFTASHRPSEFATQGYLEERGEGHMFNAPDADVLLDESFAATHCLRVVKGDDDHRDEVGLGFEPAAGRENLVDVGGVLWFDRANPVLRTLEYHYTGLEPAATRAHAGGLLVFRAMSNGVVFIERWFIRMAALDDYMLSLTDRLTVPRPERRDLRVVEIEEAGGEVAEATWPDGLHWEGTLARVTGRVVQRGSGQPAAGATVSLNDAGDISTATDSAGAFTFRQALPGPYTVWARDTSLASYGIVRTGNARLSAVRDQTRDVTIELPPLADLVAAVCEGARVPRGTTTILGRVRTADGLIVAGAAVRMGWLDDSTLSRPFAAGAEPVIPVQRTVVSDSSGHFHACGVPRRRTVQLRIESGGAQLAQAQVLLGDEPFTLVPLTVTGAIKP